MFTQRVNTSAVEVVGTGETEPDLQLAADQVEQESGALSMEVRLLAKPLDIITAESLEQANRQRNTSAPLRRHEFPAEV